MTNLGGPGHALAFPIGNFETATTVAIAVVIVELAITAWARNRYMDTPFLSATFQVRRRLARLRHRGADREFLSRRIGR